MGLTLNEAIKNNMLALMVEATEVLEEVHWKPWHKNLKETDLTKLQEEIADCLLFVFNAAYEAGMTPSDLADISIKKQIKNVKRF